MCNISLFSFVPVRVYFCRVAVLAKHIPRVFKQGTQPFTYRYVEVELASTEALFSLGFTYLLLFALAIALMFACRRNFLARLKSMAEFLLGARTPAYFCRPSQRGGMLSIGQMGCRLKLRTAPMKTVMLGYKAFCGLAELLVES